MILDELLADLVTATIIAGVGDDGFASVMPPDPSSCVMLHNPANGTPVRAMASTTDHEVSIVQAIVRDADHNTGEARIRQIYERWDKFSGTIGGKRYVSILAQHSPYYLRRDEDDRYQWTCMFNIRRDAS